MARLGKLQIGDSTAENDAHLREYFVYTDYYEDAAQFECKKSYFIGRKGVGKSAILEMIRQKKDENTIVNINPDDFALRVLSESDLIRSLVGYNNLDVVYKYIWKFVIILEILKKRLGPQWSFSSYFPGTVDNKVYKFLSQSGELGATNISMSERFLRILERLKVSLKTEGFDIQFELKPGIQEKLSQLEVFREIDNIIKGFPDFLKGHRFYVLIDDLDTEWKNLPIQNEFLSALFKGLLKLQRTRNLKFVVALREDIFSKLSIEDSDKYRDYVHNVTWDRVALKGMIEKRFQKALGTKSKDLWYHVFRKEFYEKDSFDFVYENTLGYPRDIIQLTQECILRARRNSHNKVAKEDCAEAQGWFSEKKIEDLSNEFKFIYPNLDIVLKAFHGKPVRIAYKEIEDVLLAILGKDQESRKLSWMLSFLDEPGEFIKLLIRIHFLQYRPSKRDPYIIEGESFPVSAAHDFQYGIHPCFHAALHCTKK